MYYGQIKTADTSFLGRYLAAGNVPVSIMANKRQILDDIDPDGKMQEGQVFMDERNYKAQRAKAYDYMPQTLRRQSSGPIWSNALLGAIPGALVGGVRGYKGDGEGFSWLGAGVGAGVGGLLGGASRAFNKYEAAKITPEDIALMKKQQKDRSFLGEFVPFHDMYDAYNAKK